MIGNLSLIFGSKTKAQEIVLLLNKAKEVVRQGFYAEELPRIERFCREHDLHLVKSTFKVLLVDEKGVYSNKGMRIPEEDKRQGVYFVYISKIEQKAWLAAYHELMQNDRELGLILDYPECCVNYFCQNFSNKNPNPEQKSNNMFTNLSKREKDCVILSHFPCSAECEKSIQLGRKYLYILKEQDYPRAQELVKELSN